MQGIVICERCANEVLPNEGTTIHLERKGVKFSFTFHNRNKNDCLAQEILELKAKFQTA